MWWLIIPVVIYSVGIFVLWLILRRRRGEDPAPVTGQPKISVVVAARNEEKTITALLESLAVQDYPGDLLEIIIVNDNSTDRTPIVVSEFISEYRQRTGLNIRLIYNTFQGKKSAVRYGIEKSTGELIMTTDADCVVEPGWVRAFASFYARTGADMILGEVCQRPDKGFVSLFGRLEFSALQAITEAAVVAGRPVMCNAANMAIKRDVYLKYSGALRDDIPSGDDIFLLHAVKRGGGTIRYVADRAAAVVTAGAVTAAALFRQRARWASKAYYYRDGATLTLAAATAACNAAVTAAALASVISFKCLPLLALMYIIRSVPDYLITYRNLRKKEERPPLPLFILSELIYPFYFVAVAMLTLLPSSRRFRSFNPYGVEM